jgi:hypothetical protein
MSPQRSNDSRSDEIRDGFDERSITPPVVSIDNAMREGRFVHWGTALIAISVVVGIVIGVGSIIGVIGKAFYVERAEYNTLLVRMAEDKTRMDETFKRLDSSLARQEMSLQKLTDAVESLRTDNAPRGRR